MKSWFSFKRRPPVEVEISTPTDAVATLSDEELLRKFVIERDDQAFALLVGRHSGMVLGVCRRVLGLQHDAEDAFQAVFLILSRKANTLRYGGSLPAWLHKTAFRTALQARAARSRRREESAEGLDMIAHDTCAQIASDHDGSIVDEELNSLPERYRLPLYLCCVEGKSLDVAARQLGWSVGSVKGRLERGRSELKRRLLLRRVTPALGLAALALLTPTAAHAATPVASHLIASTVQAGMQHAVGQSALGYVSQHALHLAHGSYKIMSLTALKITVCSVTLTSLALWGGAQFPSPAAEGTGTRGIVLEASLPYSSEYDSQLALAEEGGKKPAGARDGEGVKSGPRDGEGTKTGPREGQGNKAGPREGDGVRRSAEGGRGGSAETQINNMLRGFQPQNEREAVLLQMIVQLQNELAELRRTVQGQGREAGAPQMRREGEGAAGARREGEGTGVRREGDGAAKTGPRDGEGAKTGPRDGEGAKTGPRDGAPKKE